MTRIAILDDYANVAREVADWSAVAAKADIEAFDRHLPEDEAILELADFDVLCTVRERMALPRRLFENLPKLKLVTIIGNTLANLDMQAATEHGVIIATTHPKAPTGPTIAYATPELTWGLIIATQRHMMDQHIRMREGGWQTKVGHILAGQTLGILGLGRIGRRVAHYAKAFDMNVIAWSQNLTAEAAAAAGVTRVEKAELFRQADILSVHLVLSERSRGLVTASDIALMKRSAVLVNTARAPIVDQAALIKALQDGRIAGAGLDVFEGEPLAPDSPLRTMDNVTLAPHLGYSTYETLASFYGGTVLNVQDYLNGKLKNIANPDALKHPKHAK